MYLGFDDWIYTGINFMSSKSSGLLWYNPIKLIIRLTGNKIWWIIIFNNGGKCLFFRLTLIRFLRGSITNQGLHFAALKPDHKSSPVSLVSTFFDYSSIFYTLITKAIRKYINYFNLIAELRINGLRVAFSCRFQGT